jgi:hypothetical protein
VRTFFTALLLLSAMAFNGQTKRDLLSSRYSEEFLTCSKASILKPGIVRLSTDSVADDLLLDPKALQPVIEEFDTIDKTVEISWGKRLTRLRL